MRELIKKVILNSSKLLKINGKLILEIGYDQKYKVILIFTGFAQKKVCFSQNRTPYTVSTNTAMRRFPKRMTYAVVSI